MVGPLGRSRRGGLPAGWLRDLLPGGDPRRQARAPLAPQPQEGGLDVAPRSRVQDGRSAFPQGGAGAGLGLAVVLSGLRAPVTRRRRSLVVRLPAARQTAGAVIGVYEPAAPRPHRLSLSH